MATDHDLLLGRILPHGDGAAINKAQISITEFDWDDNDSDSLDDLEVPPSIRTRSGRALSNSTSDTSHTGRNSTTSRRRPHTFGDFDGGIADQMAERKETGSFKQTAVQTTVGAASRAASDVEPTELPRRLSSRPETAIESGASSPRLARHAADNYGSVDVPLRQSSRPEQYANGNGNGRRNGNATGYGNANGNGDTALMVDKPLPALNEPTPSRPQQHAIVEDVDEEENADDPVENGDDEHVTARPSHSRRHSYAPPPQPPMPSATPPPIAKPQTTRTIVYDEFDDEDGMDDDEDEVRFNGDDVRNGREGRLVAEQRAVYDKPPSAHASRRHRESEGSRHSSIASIAPRVPHRPSVHSSRTAALARDNRALRTPILDHLQMYQDAESKKPLLGRRGITDNFEAAPRPSLGKSHRSVDDGMHDDFEVGNGVARGHTPADRARNLPLRRTYSDESLAVSNGTFASNSMPDFFSTSIFQIVLHNPTTAHQLLKFSETRLCAENVEFLTNVEDYHTTLNKLAGQMASIHKNFISPGSSNPINVNGALLKRAHKGMKSLINGAFPSMEVLFTDLQAQVEMLVYQDIYPRFVRHQMAMSATRALAADRFKYQGLGDCFCLTNPNVADNPIVFASDGFVKVTGYTRPEIVPRNCRFLQGSHTDREPIRRLKSAIDQRKETVELILNYKKNGDPFWNLLYVAPLYNQRGKVEFFIGGQVNCSTTIHSNVDVLKVLSLSNEPESSDNVRAPAAMSRQPVKPSARKAFLKAFGVRHDDPVPLPTMESGMENGVLGRMEGQNLDAQMKEFYTAYSKYMVVRTSSFVIEFFSEGLIEMLNPANVAASMVAGAEVFRFFGANMLSKQNDYKTRVRGAVRSGMPVSTELRLQTRRSAVFRGDERFMAHWTPLKDDQAAVHWVVVTLAPIMM